jgi:hypothetical protein
VLTEDIEPTLRLDIAPGLSWLARRSVLASMTDGSLVVEPTPSTATGRFGKVIKPELYPCSLCGESRKDEEFLRTHRFRVSESDTTQVGYPLCKYCLGRVRSTCEFLGFLRIVKDGHWRADDEDAEKAAWEESVRLREQMFWSRIGGGVVPLGHARHLSSSSVAPSLRGEKSPRPSHESTQRPAEHAKQFLELPKAPEQDHSKDSTEATPQVTVAAVTELVPQPTSEEAVEPASEPSAEDVAEPALPPTTGEAIEVAQSPITETITETAQPSIAEDAAQATEQPTDKEPVATTSPPNADREEEVLAETSTSEQPPTEQIDVEEPTALPLVDNPVGQQPDTKPTVDADEQKQVPLAAPISITF